MKAISAAALILSTALPTFGIPPNYEFQNSGISPPGLTMNDDENGEVHDTGEEQREILDIAKDSEPSDFSEESVLSDIAEEKETETETESNGFAETSVSPKDQSAHSSSFMSSHEVHSLQLRPRIISLNIMVAGLAGLGKTTMCSALLKSLVENNSNLTATWTKTKSTVIIDESRQYEKYDPQANTILRVRIIDTPGFGNRINHKNSVEPIRKHVGYRRQLKYDREMSSSSIEDYINSTEDQLVHVCLYLLSPGRFLEIDRHFLKMIQKDIPTIIPIIAKADTLTDEEVVSYRAELNQIFEEEGINIYDFDDMNASSSDGTPQSTAFDRGRKPGEVLAIISRDGNYPWGESYSFNREHSDLRLIRDLLLSKHTERFVDSALTKYTEYRSTRLARGKWINALKRIAIIGAVTLQFDQSYLRGKLGNRFMERLSKRSRQSEVEDREDIQKERITHDNVIEGTDDQLTRAFLGRVEGGDRENVQKERNINDSGEVPDGYLTEKSGSAVDRGEGDGEHHTIGNETSIYDVPDFPHEETKEPQTLERDIVSGFIFALRKVAQDAMNHLFMLN